ncbi:hypothetical protein Gasu2_03900 [Galdieria sulphuraria]|uniref:Uncharacterized protein n=1 Tax=Galdieria sulphuraria TaxID=130081 RepID=M2XQS8_GALSU|nr:uncharacterized protein Gasu_65570 [Galdieria sulphuraria]EME25784.1 hypothetical protein Gasu_65570 [Galdieria sulphuraria]GJD05946.1 hypothetical protein Gasu2_03900 [Galdieria sulphuraria]|eukprot:XP_005702304.1 hypothetical protein Gasu_65570 [Galdieria sulphuraria]
MKQSYANLTLLSLMACLICVAIAAPPPPPPPPSGPTPPSAPTTNSESGSADGYISQSSGALAAGVAQQGSSTGDAGNYQFADGESTLALPYWKGVTSLNEMSEGSTGNLEVPTVYPAVPYIPTYLYEPYA